MTTSKLLNRKTARLGKSARDDFLPGIPSTGQYCRSEKRIPQLDGIRGLAVLMVFASHAYRSELLWSGVDMFFMLSGFLITGILLEKRARHTLGEYLAAFYRRRACRILPPYILLLCVVSLLFGIGWIRHWYLFLFFMNTEKFFHIARPYPMGALWSLAVEEQFYLIWPMIVYFVSEKALVWMSGFLLLVAPLLRFAATSTFPWRWQIYSLTIFRMDLLAAGALVALAWHHHRALIERVGMYGLLLACAMAVPLIALSRFAWFQPAAETIAANVWLYEMVLIACAGALVWALSGRVVHVLRWGPLRYMGRISYAFYLVHTMVLLLVRRHLHHYSIGNATAFVVAVLFSAASWHLMEHPILAARTVHGSGLMRWSSMWFRPAART
jgi:peptidoglycan/LPS O-acetylase OafA/YrhL